jgi:putative DNA methylase
MSFHKYWAQRPLAAARAVIFGQLVDDPSAIPEEFPTVKAQSDRRDELFKLIEKLVLWDNSHDKVLQNEVRLAIEQSWARHCEDNASHPEAAQLFNKGNMPHFWDPFAGSGAIPMSAQWLGLHANGTDLNPVAVVLNKCMIEYPWLFKGMKPVAPGTAQLSIDANQTRCANMASDLKWYAEMLTREAKSKIQNHFPDYEIDDNLTKEYPFLAKMKGEKLKTVAWIWARTVKSPNPAFSSVNVPLATTFLVSSKKGKEAFICPVYEDGMIKYVIKYGDGFDRPEVKAGTKAGGRRAAFKCLVSGVPITYEYIRSEGIAGRMGQSMMAVVVDSPDGRLYLPATPEQLEAARSANAPWRPDTVLPNNTRSFWTPIYGLKTYGDLFTERQLLAHATFSDLMPKMYERIKSDANGILGAECGEKYAKAMCVYLACVLDRVIYYGSALVGWLPKDSALGPSMPRQTIPMSWDFTEANPFGKSSGGMANCAAAIANYLEVAQPNAPGVGAQCDAQRGLSVPGRLFISTDPPYYDNIGYADLSDFFYVWLRPTLGEILPELFSTLATPKDEELVADPIRRGGEAPAEAFFIDGMTSAMKSIAGRSQEGYPITIYYAFKQSETSDQGTASTGWETFLTAVLKSGLSITGTWPIRTEGANRMVASGTNALSSSIVLVCRNNLTDLPVATKGEFLRLLKLEMPKALAAMQHACLAPVDVAQAAIGPGMAIFCRFSKVLDAAGVPMTVRDVLVEINQVLDESLAEQESEFDSDTKWAVTWFERNCFTASDFGTADMLARAKNTSVAGLIQAGIVNASAGKVKLLAPSELPADWDPATDQRLTVWEIAHHIIRSTSLGEEQAAAILAKVSTKSDSVIELTYRLFRICESKKEYDLASNYNNLIQIWPELIKISSSPRAGSVRTGEFELDA